MLPLTYRSGVALFDLLTLRHDRVPARCTLQFNLHPDTMIFLTVRNSQLQVPRVLYLGQDMLSRRSTAAFFELVSDGFYGLCNVTTVPKQSRGAFMYPRDHIRPTHGLGRLI